MKNIKNIKFLFAFCLLPIFACADYLDKQPDDMLTIDDIFSSRPRSQSYLSSIYSFIPDEMEMQNNYNMLGICDEGDFIWAASWAKQINIGNWNTRSGYYDKWAKFYKGIRSATVFINRIDGNDDPTLSPDVRACWKQEAKALRAIYYFYLIRQYGPVVLMPETELDINLSNDELQFPRSNFEDCVSFVIRQFDEVLQSPDMPETYINDNDKGRIDKRTVMAFKARMQMLAASPFWNGNHDLASFKNIDGSPMVNNTAYVDLERWKIAAKSNKELIDKILNGGDPKDGLYITGNNPDVDRINEFPHNPYLSYQNTFLERWNKEVIYARPQMASSNANNGYERHCAPRIVNGWNGVGIAQQMIDSYFMADGTKYDISTEDLTKFSSEAGVYTKAGTNMMYVNREPRFYASIIYNGADWIYEEDGKPKQTVELYFNGNCGKNGSHDHSATGYLTCKNISPNSDLINWTGVTRSNVMIRLAEIYLNYAECLNEAENTQTARDEAARYVNAIRYRAGIPDLTSAQTNSQSSMRDAIRAERRVELAFENFRAWDTRRWKIAEQTDGTPLMGMNVDKGENLQDINFYERTVIEKRVFPQKFYLWPIPDDEIIRNKACVQNPGW